MPQCKFRKQDGQRCRAKAMHGAGLCISHNPAAAKAKRAAVRKGGRNRRTPKRATRPDRTVTVQTMDDVQRLLFRTLQELRNGKLDADMARSIGYLAGVTAKVVETADLYLRVEKIEAGVTAQAEPGK